MAKRDLKPGVRIRIETRRATFKRVAPVTPLAAATSNWVIDKPGEIVELVSPIEVSTTTTLTSPSSASFTLLNTGDQYSTNARLNPNTTDRDKQVISYLQEIIQREQLVERNVERTTRFWDLLRRKKARRQNNRYWTALDNGSLIGAPTPETREDEYALYEFFSEGTELMNRVWIDYLDRNEIWVAGFTGFLSSVQDYDAAGQIGTLSIKCKSLLAMMQRSEVAVAAAIDQSYEAMEGDQIIPQSIYGLTNSLSNLDGLEALEILLRQTQSGFCFEEGHERPMTRSGGKLVYKDPANYFHQENFWQLPGDVYPYPGGSSLSDAYGWGNNSEAANPERIDYDDASVRRLNGKFVIEPSLRGEADLKIFNTMIRTTFQIFQGQNQFAYNLCREVADVMGYDFFDDPKGNIIFQPPQYDGLPRIKGSEKMHQGDVSRYGLIYSDLPYHGSNYVIGHVTSKSTRLIDTEDGLVTYVGSFAGLPWLGTIGDADYQVYFQGETTAPARLEKYLGTDIANHARKQLRRFGARRTSLKNILSNAPDHGYLSRYAYMSQIRMNAFVRSGSVNLLHRPDLWPGKTAYMVEEQKIGYIVGTTNTWNNGSQQPHSTSLTIAYVRHPSVKIGVPWQEAREQLVQNIGATDELLRNVLFDYPVDGGAALQSTLELEP